MKKKIHFIDTQYRKLCYSYLYPIRDIKQKRYNVLDKRKSQSRTRTQHDRKEKISREFQVTEADGNLMWFDATSKGLKKPSLECFLKAETEYKKKNMPEDERDCIPCIELYERFMIP